MATTHENRQYSLLIGWKRINLSQIVSIAQQLNFNCIGHICHRSQRHARLCSSFAKERNYFTGTFGEKEIVNNNFLLRL